MASDKHVEAEIRQLLRHINNAWLYGQPNDLEKYFPENIDPQKK